MLKKEITFHLLFLLIFFAITTLIKRWFVSPVFLLFWLGGIFGTFLPNLDHAIYAFFLRPHELTSQRFVAFIKNRKFIEALALMQTTRDERQKLIFHSSLFQIFFVIFAFWVISSSGSLFGRGLVTAFLIHLFVDQAQDFQKRGNIKNWFQGINLNLTKDQEVLYLVSNLLIILVVSFLF